jgi:HK97 family phage major capsid protein
MNALEKLRARLAEIGKEIRGINTTVAAENRQVLLEAEETRYGELTAERSQVETRIAQLEDEETREAAQATARELVGANVGGSPARVLSEPRTYSDGSRHSYFLDLARRTLNQGDGDGGIEAARDRLERHAAELRVELPEREAHRDEAAREQNDREFRSAGYSRRARASAFETRVNPNRTDGQGGDFVPPLWLIDEYIDLPRFGRPMANLCKNLPLPSGTDSINLPKVNTGTTVAVQTADAAAVSSTDLTDTSVSAPVRTIAGQQDIAIQLLDQSPISFDEVVMADLLADYDSKLDIQVANGSGASGQVTGIIPTSGINAVTYTDASPTLPELWVPLLQSASLVATKRKMPATGVVLTPSMWYWALSQLDADNRPLILPNQNVMNSMGEAGGLNVDGPAGMFTYGLPAALDGNIPSNLGTGTNETRIITARWQDLYLWEGQMRSRVLSEILSGTLQVRIQVYGYVGFMANRRPEAISVISGTGVIPTAGF